MASMVAGLGKPALLTVVALVVVGAGVLVAAVLWVNQSLDRVEVDGLGTPETLPVEPPTEDEPQPEPAPVQQPQEEPAESITVLLLGSDSREVLTPEERRELGTGNAEGERTETIALVRLEPDADSIRMLSIPRDTLITRCDGSRGRINAAYAIGERNGVGGMSCIVQTISAWSGLSIDHVVKIDFRGFVDIVDTLGGVPMVLDEPIVDDNANLDLPAGCTRLDGAQSLAFVRARSIDNDFGRQARQQRFIEELRREIASVGVLDDPTRLVRTAEAIARNVEVDSGLTLMRIQQLARQHRNTLRAPIEGEFISGVIDTSGGPAFLEVDEQEAQHAFRWLRYGPIPSVASDDDGASIDADGRDGDDLEEDAPTASEPRGATAGCR